MAAKNESPDLRGRTRIEGKAKVTGSATYAAEYPLKDIAYGVLVLSTVARGRITNIDSALAMRLPGVLAIISHLNAPPVPAYEKNPASSIPIFSGKEFKLFQSDKVFFNLQPVAMAVAETLEQAKYAASKINVTYQDEPHETDIHQALGRAVTPDKPSDYSRGNMAALDAAPVKVDQQYETPIQVHNPTEPHSATAYWQGNDKLFIFNKSQAVKTTQQQFAQYFNLKPENVQVHAPYVGGAFGSASRVWPHEMAAVLAAKKVGRPVKVALERTQVFNMVGYRPYSVQQYAIGAHTNGAIAAIRHSAFGVTSRYEQFMERILEVTKSMYDTDNVETRYKLVPLDVSTPCPARGPGETSGSFAMESAVDELAYALKMDPLVLRQQNFAATDRLNNLPWSSNHLQECYQLGAERFGWHKRSPEPRSMRQGDLLVGWGMSGGIYKAERTDAQASVTLFAGGRALIKSSVADTGPGSATVMTQIAANALGIDAGLVGIEWADSNFPYAPPQYGSHTTASTGSAVHDAALALRQKFVALQGIEDEKKTPPYADILRRSGLDQLEASAESKPPKEKKYSGKSFSANFVEVLVHPLTMQVQVSRVVSVVDAGRIINHKTAHSQVLGAVTWGIGLALMEEAVIDHRYGRVVNHDLAEYHVPVNADMPAIDVHFIDKADEHIDPIGVKGLGEIALIGFTAAVANAVFHATGTRVRKLPITMDKLLT